MKERENLIKNFSFLIFDYLSSLKMRKSLIEISSSFNQNVICQKIKPGWHDVGNWKYQHKVTIGKLLKFTNVTMEEDSGTVTII